MKFEGRFKIKHYDKNGKLKGTYCIKNAITDVGKNRILDVMFHGAPAASGTWYIGLINADGYTGVSADDTMGSHTGWTELITYDEIDRQEWDEAVALDQELVSTTPAIFTINADNSDIRGIFIVDDSGKAGVGGLLWSTALFSSVVHLNDEDTLKIEYELAVT